MSREFEAGLVLVVVDSLVSLSVVVDFLIASVGVDPFGVDVSGAAACGEGLGLDLSSFFKVRVRGDRSLFMHVTCSCRACDFLASAVFRSVCLSIVISCLSTLALSSRNWTGIPLQDLQNHTVCLRVIPTQV